MGYQVKVATDLRADLGTGSHRHLLSRVALTPNHEEDPVAVDIADAPVKVRKTKKVKTTTVVPPKSEVEDTRQWAWCSVDIGCGRERPVGSDGLMLPHNMYENGSMIACPGTGHVAGPEQFPDSSAVIAEQVYHDVGSSQTLWR
jgi:hypothetical protein